MTEVELRGNEEEIRKMLLNPPTAKDKAEKSTKRVKRRKTLVMLSLSVFYGIFVRKT